MRGLVIRPFERKDIAQVKKLTDQEIGQDYYSINELNQNQLRSIKNGINCSFVLEVESQVQGLRLTYPPGNWNQGKGHFLEEKKWPFPIDSTAYFQSLFLSHSFRNQGLGKELSRQSIEQLKKIGTKGIVCHSWKESPDRSSAYYLKSMGFQFIEQHQNYWKNIDYTCPRCGKPCACTAEEMYLVLP